LLKRTVDRWVTITDEQHRLMRRIGVEEDLLVRIANGYQPSPAALAARDRPRPERRFTIAMAARGSIPEKGWVPLIEAFRQLTGEVRLLLIGAGKHLATLEQQHGADPRITFAGFHPDPAVLIAGADLFALPTTTPGESLPTVIIEALSVEVPVVATDVGECRAMLTSPDGALAGAIVPVEHGGVEVARLRGALQFFIDDPAALGRARAASGAAFGKFDLTACAEAYLRLYADVLARPSEGVLQ